MTWLAIWLVGVGIADLVRSKETTMRYAAVCGVVAIAATGLLSGLTGPVDALALGASMISMMIWLRLSGRSLSQGIGHGQALAVMGLTAASLVGFAGFAGEAGGALKLWLSWADPPLMADLSATRLLLVIALLLVNLATGNIVVRLVLVSIGAIRPGPDDAAESGQEILRGGRLLGPMERIFILGLGLAGQLTAASIVVGAKGLIRFPELQSARDTVPAADGGSIEGVTEYFLVGSFVSWLIALASLAIAYS